MNEMTFLFLAVLAAAVALQTMLAVRHIRHVRGNRAAVPEAFRDRITLSAHQRAADYTAARTRAGLIEFLFGNLVLLGWTLAGGLQFLDTVWRTHAAPGIVLGTGFILSVILIASILDLPFAIYRTFVLEQRFGFNKTTPRLFVTDMLKQAMLLLVIGTPMIALVLWIMQAAGPLWWVYVWLTWLGFNLLMMWAYPAFIAPLFNKFRPLEDASLQQRIEALLDRNGFASQGVFVMDGSARSTHGNAYFTGMGTNKRIVFFDTLVNELSPEEIEAVLAHELGHFRCHHIRKRIAIMGLTFFAGLALLGWLINAPWFYSGLGVQTASTHMALTLFALIAPVFTFFLVPLFSYLSRRHEFEADDFAAAQAQTENLIQALVKLYRENANTLTPDPLYSAFHDSHPPAPIRIAHLSARTT